MTDPEAITRLIRAKTRRVNRVGLESGQLSVWLCHELRRLGVFFRHGIKIFCTTSETSQCVNHMVVEPERVPPISANQCHLG